MYFPPNFFPDIYLLLFCRLQYNWAFYYTAYCSYTFIKVDKHHFELNVTVVFLFNATLCLYSAKCLKYCCFYCNWHLQIAIPYEDDSSFSPLNYIDENIDSPHVTTLPLPTKKFKFISSVVFQWISGSHCKPLISYIGPYSSSFTSNLQTALQPTSTSAALHSHPISKGATLWRKAEMGWRN